MTVIIIRAKPTTVSGLGYTGSRLQSRVGVVFLVCFLPHPAQEKNPTTHTHTHTCTHARTHPPPLTDTHTYNAHTTHTHTHTHALSTQTFIHYTHTALNRLRCGLFLTLTASRQTQTDCHFSVVASQSKGHMATLQTTLSSLADVSSCHHRQLHCLSAASPNTTQVYLQRLLVMLYYIYCHIAFTTQSLRTCWLGLYFTCRSDLTPKMYALHRGR